MVGTNGVGLAASPDLSVHLIASAETGLPDAPVTRTTRFESLLSIKVSFAAGFIRSIHLSAPFSLAAATSFIETFP